MARGSWSATAARVVVALAGAGGLFRLAIHVTSARSEGNGGIIVRNEVISLWMHPALLDLARRPDEATACRSIEGFRRLAERRGLKKAWYVLTARGHQIDGGTVVISMIRRPYEMMEPNYSEFPDILAVAAGRPPHDPVTDFTGVEIRAIPDQLLDAEPRDVLDELRALERRHDSGGVVRPHHDVKSRPCP